MKWISTRRGDANTGASGWPLASAGLPGRGGEVNAVFGLTANRIPPAGWPGMILWTRDSGGSDGRLVSLFSAATLACAARSLRRDHGCAAGLEGHVSAARGVAPGGVRHDRERRRL